MGRIVAPFGVQGWVRIEPNTAAPGNLLAFRKWWIGDGAEWQECRVAGARTHGSVVVARLAGCDDRNQAAGLRGRQVAVPREDLPATQPGEYYWVDLIGLRVVNETGQEFGRIAGMLETGANDVLVVQGERERLIPFIADVVAAVDLSAGLVRVNWDFDF